MMQSLKRENKIGLIQLSSREEAEQNLEFIKNCLEENKENLAKYIFLPEVFHSLSRDAKVSKYLINNPKTDLIEYANLAEKYNVYFLGGSCATKVGDKVMNRIYHFHPDGSIHEAYDKIHLFSCKIDTPEKKQFIDEGLTYDCGNEPSIVDIDKLKIGLSICFDLRFPELYRFYQSKNCNLLSISSAFTKITGAAHWHTLVRARAIENQCFVVATNQVGEHNEKMTTYGHSLIVDPWGEVLVDAGINHGYFDAKIDLNKIDSIRNAVICSRKL